MNEREDKRVWYKWVELRVHGDVEAIETPTGKIPKYEDIRRLFKEVLKRDYSREDYVQQFTVRVNESIEKIDRIKKIYETDVKDTPAVVFDELEAQRRRLLEAKAKHGEYISPESL